MRILQFKISDDGKVAFTPIPGKTTVTSTGGVQTNTGHFSIEPDADAIGHSHPLESGFSIIPGPADADEVEKGKPNYIIHNGRILVVEKNDGQYQARLVAGQLGSSDIGAIQNMVDRFQQLSNERD